MIYTFRDIPDDQAPVCCLSEAVQSLDIMEVLLYSLDHKLTVGGSLANKSLPLNDPSVC